jgi:hypothetical protein
MILREVVELLMRYRLGQEMRGRRKTKDGGDHVA